VITNGKSFLWFFTDENGRPKLINQPINSTEAPTSTRPGFHYASIVRVFQELREYLYTNGVLGVFDIAAVIVYAHLLSDHGDIRLRQSLIDFGEAKNQLPELTLFDLPSFKVNKSFYNDAFSILSRIP